MFLRLVQPTPHAGRDLDLVIVKKQLRQGACLGGRLCSDCRRGRGRRGVIAHRGASSRDQASSGNARQFQEASAIGHRRALVVQSFTWPMATRRLASRTLLSSRGHFAESELEYPFHSHSSALGQRLPLHAAVAMHGVAGEDELI